MRLVVDASVLVAEALRKRGHALIAHPELELFIAEHAWSEVRHELRKRVTAMERHGRLSAGAGAATFGTATDLVRRSVGRVAATSYSMHEPVALGRVPRDPNDWPTVAAALLLDAGIWTADCDLLGRGLPTWTTETLLAHFGG